MAIFKRDDEDSQFGNVKAATPTQKKKSIPPGLWTKCPICSHVIYNKSLKEEFSVCPKCDYHFVITAWERIEMLLDAGSFVEFDSEMVSVDALGFKGVKSYVDKLKDDQQKTKLKEACITGEALLNGKRVACCVTDSRFIMGSMGAVVGEKLTRLIEFAGEQGVPLIVVSGSGGGARMYEGALSLMQMAKTSAALYRFGQKNLVFISVLTNPTMGGVMASFASLGDVIVAEPKALLGFAGPRVIEQTIRQKLPEDFQTSEFLLEHGMIDKVISRKDLKQGISQLLEYLA